MARPFQPGQRVETLRLGAATIVRPTPAGALIRLDRMPTTVIEIPSSQITAPADRDAGARLTGPSVNSRHKSMPSDQLKARRSIEALRFGIVPLASVSDVTVGFEELSRWVSDNLPHNRRNGSHVSEISGAFGTGKSHTMAAIRLIAQEQGYLTAHVEVNGSSVTLSDPAGVLRQLWPTTKGTDLESATPILELHVEALDNGLQAATSMLQGFERIQDNLRTVSLLQRIAALDHNADDLDVFLSCGDAQTASGLRGQLYADLLRSGGNWSSDPFDVKRLIGQRVEDRPTDFVKCLLGYSLLGRRAGFKGLVVTIDEFEVEVYHLSASKLERIEGLAQALMEQLGKGTAPLALFVATVGDQGHAGDEIVSDLVSSTRGDVYELPAWTKKSMRELARRIHSIYCAAYAIPDSFQATDVKVIESALEDADVGNSGVVRAFIKAYVSLLDTTYGPVMA